MFLVHILLMYTQFYVHLGSFNAVMIQFMVQGFFSLPPL